jgi:microcystin-dependent protein
VSQPFLSEIKIISWNFPAKGWAFCNGQLLPINQNQALFSLLGTTYGGDGRNTFALPNLQGRTPVHSGNGFSVGQLGGEAAHTLSVAEVPTHTHAAYATATDADSFVPTDNYLGGAANTYGSATNLTTISPSTIGNSAGSGQAHNNMQPYLVLNFCIALQGIYPSQN